MPIFDYENYKTYISDLLLKMPHEGYGQFRKIAHHLKVNSVVISQIFRGNRDLSVEQAYEVCGYFGFSEMETRCFLLLVQLHRAGTHKLREHYQRELAELRAKSLDLKHRVPKDKDIGEEARAQFYSNWYYSAIRLLSSIDGFQSVDAISEALKLPRATVKRASEFLLQHGLCVEDPSGLHMGPSLTHLEATSPMITRHHTNWRLKGLQNMEPLATDELFYSAPMALSREARARVRKELVEVIQRALAEVQNSESECTACLNIDWFDFLGDRA